MRASIIVPTYNRAAVLQVCLEAIAALHTDPATFEVIVADNNSTDDTAQVCQAVATAQPMLRLRYVFEGVQGVSHARNRAVAEACGDIVCFLDDDSPPAADWLDALLQPFDDPAVGCAGGPSIPDYQGADVPAWLRGDLQGLLSGYGLPYAVPTPVRRWEELPLSCNMAIRRELFAELGSFRTDLDRRGDQVLAAGDTEMADRIAKAGWLVIYVPGARVHHLVPPQRLTKAHVYRIGRGLAESHIILTSGTGALGVLRWFASDGWYATRMGGRLLPALLRRDPLWFDDYMRFWMVAQRIPLRVRSLLGPRAG
ncbi:MAG: glycosyltransferase family 2 protein [Caldilineaceae bacterium]|nr:glycosyltransferase family 2 protein [Caldilineaceae bacterium]